MSFFQYFKRASWRVRFVGWAARRRPFCGHGHGLCHQRRGPRCRCRCCSWCSVVVLVIVCPLPLPWLSLALLASRLTCCRRVTARCLAVDRRWGGGGGLTTMAMAYGRRCACERGCQVWPVGEGEMGLEVGYGSGSWSRGRGQLLSRRIYFSIPLIIYARNRIHTLAHTHTHSHTHMGIYWLFILYSNARGIGHRTCQKRWRSLLARSLPPSPAGRTVSWGVTCVCVCIL